MSTSIQNDLREFAIRLLEECGGAVEWNGDRDDGVALVPADVASAVHVSGETLPLTLRPEGDGLCISLAGGFLESAEKLLATSVPRVAVRRIPDRYLKGGDLLAAVDKVFTWQNVRVRLAGADPVRTEYHHWWFYCTLRSEDVWDSLVPVTVNALSQGPVELPDVFDMMDLQPADDDPPPTGDTFAAAVRLAERRVPELAANFLERMDGRLERDRKRLRDYYNTLLRGAAGSRRKNVTPPSAEDVAARKRAVDLELRRKLGELQERFAVDAAVEPVTMLRVLAPTLAVRLTVRRKQAEREHTVYWNSLSKEFEPLPCSRCGAGAFSVTFTNEDVAALCSACAG